MTVGHLVYVRLGIVGVNEGIGTAPATITPDDDHATGIALAYAAKKAMSAALADLAEQNARNHEH